MIVAVASEDVALHYPDDFRGFHVLSQMPREGREILVASLARIGARVEGEHAWVPLFWLSARGSSLGSEWSAGLTAMVDYARVKGWIDEPEEAIRAHIEWPEDA